MPKLTDADSVELRAAETSTASRNILIVKEFTEDSCVTLAMSGLDPYTAEKLVGEVALYARRPVVSIVKRASPLPPAVTSPHRTPRRSTRAEKSQPARAQKAKGVSQEIKDGYAEAFFRAVSGANGAEVSAEDVAKLIGLKSPRSFASVYACLRRVYPADHPMRTVQFPAIVRIVRDGAVWFKYAPQETPSS